VSYGPSVTLARPFGEVVTAVRAALATEGFGVLTEIDVQATMKAKLSADMGTYLILGACNPPLTQRALQIDPSIGLLLPCNIVVRQTEHGTTVSAVDPMMMVSGSSNPALQPIADEAAGRLNAALAALSD
jgi:uncharacterized protein (DUF302 family)